jgi:hypothetical protein
MKIKKLIDSFIEFMSHLTTVVIVPHFVHPKGCCLELVGNGFVEVHAVLKRYHQILSSVYYKYRTSTR